MWFMTKSHSGSGPSSQLWSRREIALGVALCAVLVTLATLQYRWIEQLADLQRVELDQDLRVSTNRFVNDFNRELQGLARILIAGGGSGRVSLESDVAERLSVWRQTSSHAGLVRQVWLADNPKIPSQLRELVSRIPDTDQTIDLGRRRGAPPVIVDSDIPAMAIPVITLPDGIPFDEETPEARAMMQENLHWLVVEFDLNYIKNMWLPELVERHFGKDFYVEVIGPQGRVYASDEDAETAPLEDSGSGRLFSLEALGRGRGRPDFGGFDGRGRGGPRRTTRDREGNGLPTEATAPLPPGAPEPPPPPGTLPPPNAIPPDARRLNFEGPPEFLRSGWSLRASHREGPLEVMVADFRSRNLAISFGMLLLMGVSVAMLMLSSRKARLLANQQMEFVAGVTHELRTPLAVITAASQNLADGVTTDQNQVKRYGGAIRDQGKRLTSMVEQVLRFAGLASGRMEIQQEHVNLEDVIYQAVGDCQPELAASGTECSEDIETNLPVVTGDPEALGHALRNLLVNAAKHGEGSPVRIIAGASTEGKKATVRIAVRDQGPGIDPADLPHIFEPFYRGKRATSEQIRGSGLGLALVQKIVEAHHGRIEVESSTAPDSHGTTFTMQLPAEDVVLSDIVSDIASGDAASGMESKA